MATITATHLDAPSDRSGRRIRVRTAQGVRAVRRAAKAVSTARLPLSPVLTASGFVLVDTSAFELAAGHISPGIGLLVTGISVWLFDWSRD